MKIILHIGTHKTGTSSIQNFLAGNRETLAARDIYYPLSPQGARNLNFLASHLASARKSEVSLFIKKIIKDAQKRGLNTLLISAESLYAMTSFFRKIESRHVEDYWESEQACIEILQGLLSEHEVSIVCYIRPQSVFIESMYNQFVKQAPGYSGGIDSFISQANEMGDYYNHLLLWEQAFGSGSLNVRKYDDVKDGLLKDFLENVLCVSDIDKFRRTKIKINKRLNHDVLLFKRIINRIEMPITERLVISRILMRLSNEQAEMCLESTLLTPGHIKSIMERYDNGNNEIAARYPGVAQSALLFPQHVEMDSTESFQDELSVEKGMELLLRYEKEVSRPGIKLEILMRRMIRCLLEKFPVLETRLKSARCLQNKRLQRLESQGRL